MTATTTAKMTAKMTDRSIVDAAARLRKTGEPYLVATVVAVRGDGYRRPGARMLLTRFRWVATSVSGGSLEGDIATTAWARTRDGRPVLVTYDSACTDADVRSAFGLGCDCAVDVLLERSGITGRIDALEVAERCVRHQRRGAVATVIRTDMATMPVGTRLAIVDRLPIVRGGLEEETNPFDPHVRELVATDMREAIEDGDSVIRTYDTPFGTIDVFIEALVPPPRLFLFGTGHDAVPVAQVARSVGWDVVVCAPQPRHATRDRFTMADEIITGSPADIAPRIAATDRAIAIVMNHDAALDHECCAMLLATGAHYIGMPGPRTLLDRRIHALPLATDTPQELALAIVADVLGHRDPPAAREHAGGSAATIAAAGVR